MKFKTVLFSTAAASLLTSLHGLADVTIYTVPATANIFSAGLSAPAAPGGNGAGILPIEVSFAPGSAFQFQALGDVSPYYGLYDLHGEGTSLYATSINAYGGISGFMSDQAFPLAGVFLSEDDPQPPAPATLDFSSTGLNFLDLSPQIGQVFFIGDGLTDDSLIQSFYAPAGASMLYLGFPDGVNFVGDPGSFIDNYGSLSVSVTVVPEPAATLLILSGLALRWAIRKCPR
jgi:hypothetical protein